MPALPGWVGTETSMHISDGVVSMPVLATGFVATAALAAVTLKSMDLDEIPKISVATAVFFVASLIHVPIGPGSMHLILNGLVGVILGWRAFPAIMIAIILQAILFGHGGVSVIGVNSVMLGGGALLAFGVWQLRHWVSLPRADVVFGALAGAAGLFFSGLIMALALVTTGEAFVTAAKAVIAAHLVLMVVEGAVAAACINFLLKVKPDLLAGYRPAVTTQHG